LCEYLSKEFPSIIRSEGYRTTRWKYIRWIDRDVNNEELYDLHADPLEERNLAGSADNGAVLRETRERCGSDIARYEKA